MALWYKGPNPTVDLVMFFNNNDSKKVLLIQRDTEPFKGYWALPGGFIDGQSQKGEIFMPIETAQEAALRECKEETNIDFEGDIHRVGIYEGHQRDPRDTLEAWTRSHAFMVHAPVAFPTLPQAGEVKACQWWDVQDIIRGTIAMAFDHGSIVQDAMDISVKISEMSVNNVSY